MDKLIIPNNIVNDISELLREHDKNLIKKFSLEFNINEKEIIDKCCNNTNFQLKKDIQNAEVNNLHRQDVQTYIDDINSKDDLKKYKLPKLKFICSEYKLKKTGNKSILIDRIWDKIDN
tara:strand:- start:1720 stop:2076 length:357 start_codon:yes stop_codon:yes gene_type:complete